MTRHPEPQELLRETLEKYIHDLAEEMVYWMEELNKLDMGAAEGTDPLGSPTTVKTAIDRWAARTGRRPISRGGTPASGK